MAPSRAWLGSTAIAVAVMVALVLTLPITLTPGLRTRLTAGLAERFDSQVELENLRISILPRLRVSGGGVVLRHRGRTDVPPLITVASFSAEAGILGLIGRPLRLQRVHLTGLEINVPPGGMALGEGENGDAGAPPRDSGTAAPPADGTSPDMESGDVTDPSGKGTPIIVDDVLAERAVLKILRGDPDKEPRLFEIHHLSMQDAGSHDPWTFRATLTNPTPPGDINTHGTFGPWNGPRPAQTPLEAEYEFTGADLSVFEGIRGTLNSTGAFSGVLEQISVVGRASVPEFALAEVGNAVALEASFHSTVDGTNGNTWLKPVEATLGRSLILAHGGVVEEEGENGRTVTLDVVMNDARIEDVLRLALKAKQPPMTGALKLETTFVLPPGVGAAVRKMRLDGTFEIARARFTAGNIQAKVNELSHKASAEEREEAPEAVVSDFTGRFTMRDGVIRFSRASFSVPGARVDVTGTFTLAGEALDFRGTVRLDATLSQLTTGVKSFLLRLVDPLMRRKDVTVIPVTIGGTVDDPKFGLDVRRAVTRG